MPDTWYKFTNAASPAMPARVDIYDFIGDGENSAREFIARLNAVSASAIDLHISSGGGWVDDGLAIYNELRRHPATITAYIDGMAASMATVIAMAADHIVMSENASFMVHNPAGMAVGEEREMNAAAKRLAINKASIINAYARRVDLSRDEISAIMDAVTWMDADEALAGGWVDEIGADVPMAASVDLSRFDRVPGRVAAMVAAHNHNTNAKQENAPMADEPKTPAADTETDSVDYKAKCDELANRIAELEAAAENQANTARADAVKAERQRIADVQALTYPGIEAVIAEAVESGANKADAALKIAEYEKARTTKALADLKTGAPAPVAEAGDSPSGAIKPEDMDDDQLRAHFRNTDTLHSEHLNADQYVAFMHLQRKRGGK